MFITTQLAFLGIGSKKQFGSYSVYAFTSLFCGTNHLPNACA